MFPLENQTQLFNLVLNRWKKENSDQ